MRRRASSTGQLEVSRFAPQFPQPPDRPIRSPFRPPSQERRRSLSPGGRSAPSSPRSTASSSSSVKRKPVPPMYPHNEPVSPKTPSPQPQVPDSPPPPMPSPRQQHSPPRPGPQIQVQHPTPRGPMPFNPEEDEDEDDALATLNFHRRPSAAPFQQDRKASWGTPQSFGSRFSPTTADSGRRALQPPAPIRTHAGNPGSTSAGRTLYQANRSPFAPVTATTSDAPEMRQTQGGGTRAPLDSFASIDMLRGQREQDERLRGREAFAPSTEAGQPGFYEGRTRDAPGDISSAAYGSQSGPYDTLRPSLQAYKWSSAGPTAPEPAASRSGPYGPTLIEKKNFEFPARSTPSPTGSHVSLSAPAYEEHDLGMSTSPLPTTGSSGDTKVGSPAFLVPQSVLDKYASNEKLSPLGATGSGGWRTEPLGPGSPRATSFDVHRPSIVALPQYPTSPTAGSRTYASIKSIMRRRGHYFAWTTLIFSLLATWYYVAIRVENILAVHQLYPDAWSSAWVYLGLEVVVYALLSIKSVVSLVTYRAPNVRTKLRLRGDQNLPSIDVMIVSSGQSDQVVFDSAVAAASMDYPTHRFRVMVIDPTCSPELQRKLTSHGKTQACPHLTYHRRVLSPSKGDVHLSKAASLNFGVSESRSMGVRGPGEYVAVFDASVIPERNFLRAALPKMVLDSDVALVETLQGFMNLPQRLSHPTATLLEACESERQIRRSGFILRRHVLDRLGGFPKDSWITDGEIEARMLGAGFRTAHVDEVLQYATAQPTYGGQVGAMMAADISLLRTALRLNFFLWGKAVSSMTFGQRLAAFSQSLTPVVGAGLYALTILNPILFAYSGLMVLSPDLDSLKYLLVWTLVMIICVRLHEMVFAIVTGLATPRRTFQAWVFAAPYRLVALLRLILPTWLGGFTRPADSGAITSALPFRPSFGSRLGWLVLDPHTWVVTYFLVSVGMAVHRCVDGFASGVASTNETALTLLLTLAWPSLIWFDFFLGSIVPLSCLLFPSKLLTEPRESFLIRDHFSSVARPKHAFKSTRPFKANPGTEVLAGSLEIVWASVAVALAMATTLFI